MQEASVFSERGPKTTALARPAGGAGFSLVEVAIAGAIIVVGMLALISLFPVSSANLVASASTTGAVGLGAQQIETMRNLPFPPAGGNDTATARGHHLRPDVDCCRRRGSAESNGDDHRHDHVARTA